MANLTVGANPSIQQNFFQNLPTAAPVANPINVPDVPAVDFSAGTPNNSTAQQEASTQALIGSFSSPQAGVLLTPQQIARNAARDDRVAALNGVSNPNGGNQSGQSNNQAPGTGLSGSLGSPSPASVPPAADNSAPGGNASSPPSVPANTGAGTAGGGSGASDGTSGSGGSAPSDTQGT